MSTNAESLSSYFRSMDSEFVGMEKIHDEEFLYRASDVLVQSTWELPIVIQWPNSFVSYEFSSSPGDISFGVVFVAAPLQPKHADELEIETVEDMDKVPSCNELISGSFDVPTEGVLFFLWDNNFDWSSVKQISYSIKVKQPSFSLPDQERSIEAKCALKSVVDDLEICYTRHADGQDSLEHNFANVSFLQDQIQKMEKRLSVKKSEFYLISNQISNADHQIWMLQQSKLGLCIRMLNRHLLSFVLNFLPVDHPARMVNKYWYELMRLLRSNPVLKSEYVYEKKMAKNEKNRLLFDIHLRNNSFNSRQTSEGISASVHDEHRTECVIKQRDGVVGNESTSISSSASDTFHNTNTVPKPMQSSMHISYRHVLPQLSSEVAVKPLLESQFTPSSTSPARHKVPDREEGNEPRTKALKLVGGKNRTHNRKQNIDDALLQNLLQIRSEQQLTSMAEYINSGLLKIESLSNEKRRVKKLIRAWNTSYESRHGRLPSSVERKGHLRELHEEYQQLTLALRVKKDKLDEVLKKVGISAEQFEELRISKFNDM